MSDFDLHPFSLFKAHSCEDETGNLITKNAHPDSDDAKAQCITKEIRDSGTDDGDTDGGCNGSVESITCTPQAAHVDDLTDLEDHDKDDDMHDLYTDGHNMLFGKEQVIQATGTKIIDADQTYGNHGAYETAGTPVFLGKLRITGTQTSSDQGNCRGLQTVPEGKGQCHDIHANLMSGHCIGSLRSCHDGGQHEADPHQNLFKEHAVANLNKV